MCWRHFGDPKNIDLEKNSIIETIFGMRHCYAQIDLAAAGEAAVHPDFEEIVDFLALHDGLKIHITTNGSFVKQYLNSFLKMTFIRFSLESLKNYELTRVGGTLSGLVEAIKLIRLKRSFGFPKLGIGLIVLRSNLEEFSEIAAFAEENEIEYVGGQHLESFEVGNEFFERETVFAIKNLYNEARKRLDNRRFVNMLPRAFREGDIDLSEFRSYKTNCSRGEKLNSLLCQAPWVEARINPLGEVTPCGSVNNVSLGNIHNNFFWDIWNSQNYVMLRKGILKSDPVCRCGIPSLLGRKLGLESFATIELGKR